MVYKSKSETARSHSLLYIPVFIAVFVVTKPIPRMVAVVRGIVVSLANDDTILPDVLKSLMNPIVPCRIKNP